MRKQYKKARYKRAGKREYERKCPGIKVLRKNIEGLKKAAYECGRSIATTINNMILGKITEEEKEVIRWWID